MKQILHGDGKRWRRKWKRRIKGKEKDTTEREGGGDRRTGGVERKKGEREGQHRKGRGMGRKERGRFIGKEKDSP